VILSRSSVSTADVAAHYDALDPFYRELWGDHLHHGLWERGDETADEAVLNLVRRVSREAGLASGSTVCDVGAGYGATARVLANDPGARVTAITLSAIQHEFARRATPDPRVRHVLADWFDYDPGSGSFDAVIAIESTAHMPDKAAFFRKAAAVLRPGGRVVVCAWLAAGNARRWHRKRLLEPICREGRLPSLGTAAEYEAWIEQAGLQLMSYTDLSSQVSRTWKICTKRVIGRLLTKSSSWSYLLNPTNRDRVFALTVPRILAAYATGSMQYGLFVASRP